MRSPSAALLVIGLSACQVSVVNRKPDEPVSITPSSDLQYVVPTGAAATLPFSPVVRVGNVLYLAGQLGTDATGKLVPGGIASETRQAMENIKALVESNGSSMDRVVKCTVMLADINEWAAMNAVYVTYFPNHKPARSAFGASGLARGGRAEIECMALAG